MLSKNYLLYALNSEAFKYKAWVFEVFSIVSNNKSKVHPFGLIKKDKKYSFIDPETNEEIIIEDSDNSKPLFTFQDRINLSPNEVPNLDEVVESTVGQLLVNYIGLIYSFGDRIPYQNGEFNIKTVEEIISKKLTTDKKYQDSKSFKPENPIYVSEYLKFIDNISTLEGFSQLCVPSASPRTLTTDPEIEKRKKELLEKHKDELDDPTVIANIESELIEMDKAWIKGDMSEGFYIKGKHFKEVRKKAHIMYGVQSGFGETSHLSTQSLNEGWEEDKMPGMVNALREGSYSRGKGTAMGGYETKIVNRMFQNVSVKEDDCGTTMGWDVKVTRSNAKDFIGFYYIDKNKKPVLIETETYKQLVGESVIMRSPQFCKSSGTKFCRKCLGLPNTENENALSAYVAEITSKLMTITMAKMHDTQLKTTTYDINKSIS